MSSADPPTGSESTGSRAAGGQRVGRRAWLPRAHPISWAILVITTLAILMTAVDGGLLTAVLPAVARDFGLNTTQLGWVNSAFFAGTILGALGFGLISDRIGTGYRRSWTWTIAMFIGVLGGALTFGFASSFLAFVVLRVVMGISRGGSEPTNVALVGEWWPREHRGFAVGVHHTGFPFGQFATGALVALVLAFFSWQQVFLLVPLLGVPVMVAQVVIGRRRQQQKVFDWIDTHGMTRPTQELSVRGRGIGLESVKVALRHPNVRWSILLIFLLLWVETGAATFLTTQFTQLGMSDAQAALISGATGLTGWIGQVLWGTVSDGSGRKFSLKYLVVGWVVSMLLLTLVTGPGTAWLFLLVWGLVRNAPFPVTYALLIDSVPKAAGTAMGLMIGLALGVSGLFAGPVSGWIIGRFGFTTHYLVLAAICALCAIPLRRMTETAGLRRGQVIS
jgi:MFS family permease